ncbi:cadherin-like beta sandwich domain-containing protein [Cohnella sp. GCM10027633]|uniref:cadherin-like beta sandwich domain-containing protein n=1 Tax=unclassified Cohnella TaxID=2636738 RepID=UPI00364527F4
MRKGLIYLLAMLVLAVPLLGAFSKEAAAASSRVAVIKELKGTVKVQKSGGSKEFTAFAKMSLNEGDVLSVGDGGSAVLQFSNGTSDDDKMTVASNTKLTFSKLSNKKGTTTKVSMWKGSAWVDVKSIANADDEFTLETPTAVMGVRGTHLLVNVDPLTGATRLMVAAGIVNTSTPGKSDKAQNVYPTQNALITGGEDENDSSDITVAPADLELLMKQSEANIIEAILLAAKEIVEENEDYSKKFEEQVPSEIGGTEADLARFKSNTENLLGAIADQAVKSGLIDQERLNKLVEEVKSQSGFDVDLTKKTLQTTQEEEQKKAKQREVEEQQKKAAEEKKVKEQQERDKQAELQRKIEEARLAAEKAKKAAEDEKKRKAQEAYEKQLDEAGKKRFDDDKKQRQQEQSAATSTATATATSTSTTPPVQSNNANLSGLSLTEPGSSLNLITFSSADTYTVNVSNTTAEVAIKSTVAHSGATVKVNGQSASSGIDKLVTLNASGTSAGTVTTIPVLVTAQNGTTKTYTIVVNRAASLLTGTVFIQGLGVGNFRPDQGVYNLSGINSETLEMSLGQLPAGVSVSLHVNGQTVPYSSGKNYVPLAQASNLIMITVTSTSLNIVQIYTISVTHGLSNDASLSVVAINEGYLTPVNGNYEVTVDSDIISAYILASKQYEGATVVVKKGATIVSANELSLEFGENVFKIIVTAPDGVTTRTYTLTITRVISIPNSVTSWSVQESLNGAAPKRIYEGEDEVGRPKYEYSVAVEEETDSVHLNMLFEVGELEPEWVKIYDQGATELFSYTASEEENIVVSNFAIPLEADGAYTRFFINYQMRGEESYSSIEFTVLRGDPGEYAFNLTGVSASYGEYNFADGVAYGENSYFIMMDKDALAYDSFVIAPMTEHADVYQWLDGVRTKLGYGYMGFEPMDIVDGWNDFDIDVWDYSLQQYRTYELHVYYGEGIPEPFNGLTFEAKDNTLIGESSSNASRWYLELEGASPAVSLKLSGAELPSNIALEGVYTGYDGLSESLAPDGDGYYSLNPESREGTIRFVFATNGREFVYTIEVVSAIPLTIDSATLYDRTTFGMSHVTTLYSNQFDNMNIANYELPHGIDYVILKPMLSYDDSKLSVSVDGIPMYYFNNEPRGSAERIEVGNDGKSIDIVIRSPSGIRSATYIVNLTRTPAIPGSLSSVYIMGGIGSNPSLLDFAAPAALKVGETAYFSSYRGNGPVNLILTAFPSSNTPNIEVYLDHSSETLTLSGGYYQLTELATGWHAIDIYVYDSHNSNSTHYTYNLWIGENPPEAFDIDGFYAIDGFDALVDFSPVSGSNIWRAEVVPDAEMVFLNEGDGYMDPNTSIQKIVLTNGTEAQYEDNMFEIVLDEDGITEAQMWLENDGQIFVIPLEFEEIGTTPIHVTGMNSWKAVSMDPISWQYSSAYRFYTELELNETELTNGIILDLVPESGYEISYAGGVIDPGTGLWTGLSNGLNTLEVTIKRGNEWDTTYTFNAIVNENEASSIMVGSTRIAGIRLGDDIYFSTNDDTIETATFTYLEGDNSVTRSISKPAGSDQKVEDVIATDMFGRPIAVSVHVLFGLLNDLNMNVGGSVSMDGQGLESVSTDPRPGWNFVHSNPAGMLYMSFNAPFGGSLSLYDINGDTLTPTNVSGTSYTWEDVPLVGGKRQFVMLISSGVNTSAAFLNIVPDTN